jgi:hypothetical protein
METTVSPQESTEKVLMEEFGAYLGAIADGFSGKLQTAMQDAENEMRARLGVHAEKMAVLHREASERAAAQHRMVEQEVQSFGSLIRKSQAELEDSRRNFEAAILKDLTTTLQKESEELRSSVNAVHRSLTIANVALASGRNALRYFGITATLALVILAIDLWKLWN